MFTPRKFFFFLGLVFLILGFLLEGSSILFSEGITKIIGGGDNTSQVDIKLARYYWSTGRLNEAIEEYSNILSNENFQDKSSTESELRRLLLFENSARGKFIGILAYISWAYPPKLFLLALITFACLLILLFFPLFRRKTILAILPFQNSSDLKFGDDFPMIAANKIREIVWQSQRFAEENGFLAESLELPVFGMVTEETGFDSLALLETAMQYTVGINDLPLSRLFASLKLWFEQPAYTVRGFIHGNQSRYSIHMLLYEGNTSKLEKSWHTDITPEQEEDIQIEIIDAMTYPLLSYFSKNIKARSWRSLCKLNRGLQSFQDYRNHNYHPKYIQDAKRSLTQALDFEPGYQYAQYNLGLILLLAGEYEEARQLLHTLSETACDQKLKELASYHYGVGLFHLSQDWAYGKAASVFEDLLAGELDQAIESSIQSTLAVTYAKMANRQIQEKESLSQRAIATAEQVIASTSSSKIALANAYSAIGYAAFARGDFAATIHALEKSFQLNPENVSNMLGLAEAYIHCDQKMKAIDICQQAAMVSPNGEYPNYRIGSLYLQMKDIDHAKDAFQKAPNIAVARLAIGKIFLSEMQNEDALEQFRVAVAINKKLSEAWVNIAWAILEIGSYSMIDEAVAAARRAVQLEKNGGQFWHRHAVLSRALLAAQKYENAIKEAQTAVNSCPEKPSAKAQSWYYLAQSQFELGIIEQAEETLNQIFQLRGVEDWAIKANLLLAKIKKMHVSGN